MTIIGIAQVFFFLKSSIIRIDLVQKGLLRPSRVVLPGIPGITDIYIMHCATFTARVASMAFLRPNFKNLDFFEVVWQ